MELQELTQGLFDLSSFPPFAAFPVDAISCDSRQIQKNSLFVALKGLTYNGAQFVDDAIQKGARVIVKAQKEEKDSTYPEICFLYASNPHQTLRDLTKRFYGDPSQDVRTMGVTGTNGKTTITYLIESIVKEANKNCGLIGTIEYRIGGKNIPSHNTTPSFLETQQLLSQMKEDGMDYCVMEVSSHALDQGRVDGINFKTAVFTNLTSDHLDYHETVENYFAAKAKLFTDLASDAYAVINVDDRYGRKLISMTEAKTMSYGIENNADLMAKDIQHSMEATQFKLATPDGEAMIRTPLVGAYNIYNILAAAAAGFVNGFPLETIRQGIERVKIVPGRLERINCGQNYTVIVDYAHTEDALEHVLKTIRHLTDARVILVFGCGGDRDKTKRSPMGKVASQWATQAIITNDNPRTEDPRAILDQIVAGFQGNHYCVISDREEAIQKALNLAQPGDVVLITGKGHESYQIFKEGTIKFDERQIVRSHLYERQSVHEVPSSTNP